MKIYSQIKNSFLKVYVNGNIQTREEQYRFLKVFDGAYDEIEIFFSDVEFLPALLIDRLSSLIDCYTSQNVHIYTDKQVLSSYLVKLNIDNKKLQKTDTIVYASAKKDLQVLAIGGSAGSFERIKQIIAVIPYIKGLAIFIAQHIKDSVPSKLPEIYQKYTNNYNVLMPESDTIVETGNIYIAPPDCHMMIIGGYIYLTKEKPVNYSRPSISVLFSSLANVYKDTLLAILLCGYGLDGVDCLESLKKVNSTVIVEKPVECEAKSIPYGAIESGFYDYIFSLDDIIRYIKKFATVDSEITDQQLNNFFMLVKDTYDYDFIQYDKKSIKRSIKRNMKQLQTDDFDDFKNIVLSDFDSFKDLLTAISINVTHFFRNSDAFYYLREKVIPYLDSYHRIKVWCAGCATGQECYTLAIMFDELGLLDKIQIYATDFNSIVLEQAKNGIFSFESLKVDEIRYNEAGGTKNYRDYFTFYSGYMKVIDRLKEKVLFFSHNLTTDGVFNEFQLILCRNVLIYFDKDLQERVLKLFYDSLDMSGFLMLGDSEGLNYNNGDKFFTVNEAKYRIFKKRNTIK